MMLPARSKPLVKNVTQFKPGDEVFGTCRRALRRVRMHFLGNGLLDIHDLDNIRPHRWCSAEPAR